MKSILITGGAGYIGSHTIIELLNENFNIIALDNFSNSSSSSLERIKQITDKDITFYEGDILDIGILDTIFGNHKIDSVIHFAGLKAVGESTSKPLNYYHNNVSGTNQLLLSMIKHGVKKIVFSSSATVYGKPKKLPLHENMVLENPTNPYGRSKVHIEQMLNDLYISDKDWNISILRYFNPVGAHFSGLIGENPKGIPNNLMPFISQVGIGKLKVLNVFGNDYDTHDGTGVRDYIHVSDLACGHIAALTNLKKGISVYNLGTGAGHSVMDLIKTFEKVNKINIPFNTCPRRPGDIDICFSDVTKAKKELLWEAKRSLEDICKDEWRWQKNNNKEINAQ